MAERPAPPADAAAMQFMVLDLLEQILSYAEHPSQLGAYLTQQIRQLIGGRAVALWEVAAKAKPGDAAVQWNAASFFQDLNPGEFCFHLDLCPRFGGYEFGTLQVSKRP